MEQVKPNFDIGLLKLDELEKLSEVFRLCFGFEPKPGYFKWKYFENPAGEVAAFVARCGDDIAGFYGVIPETYVVDGKQVTVYQSMDTMTHPNYRRMGLFTTLAKATYEYIEKKDGSIYLVGFPGDQSFHGFVNRLDWENICDIPYVFVHRVWYSFFCGKPHFQIEPFASFRSEGIPYFSGKRTYAKPISKLLNTDVLHWRVDRYPGKEYLKLKVVEGSNVIGCAVVEMESGGDRAFITFIDMVDYGMVKQLVRDLTSYIFTNSKVKFVYSFEPSVEALLKAYKNAGYVKNPFRKGWFSYRNPFIVYANQQNINGINWFDASNFELQPIIRDY